MRVSPPCKILVARRSVYRESEPSAKLLVTPDSKNCVKRFTPFLHYPNKWKTSRCRAMSHGLGPQPGNPRLGSSRVPEPTGKRLRRFVRQASPTPSSLAGADRFVCPKMTGVLLFPVRAARSIPPTIHRCSSHTALKRPASVSLTLVPENSRPSLPQVLHCLPLPAPRGKYLEFHSFDEAYVERLRAGDSRTQEDFGAYFSTLIQVKLRSRLQSREAIEDVRQETFARFYSALREGKILHPERLGSFVNSICNNVLLEHYRAAARHISLDDEQKDLRACAIDLLGALSAKETEKKVREILDQLSERDRRLLREVFLEERNKDEVCRDFGVDREYLRVLLHRAKQSFKTLYKKNTGNDSPEFTPA
jgi:RNA polymerase sigma-70 factor, ECF subfamily